MQTNQLIVINAGSSSIKFAAYEFNAQLNKSFNGYLENIKTTPVLKIFGSDGSIIRETKFEKKVEYEYFFELLISAFASNQFNYTVSGVGHRVVHGGSQYTSPVLLTEAIVDELKKFIPFAPLHQPFNLQAIESIYKAYPTLPQAACFDTSFHRTHPLVADLFGIPRKLTESGIRRYGFHGLSYEYIMYKLKEIQPEKVNSRIIVAHLGNGSSMCAIKNGISIETTMGFTALDGLMMGTRCGSLDPGVVIYLIEYLKMPAKEIEKMLYSQSGLLGVSGLTYDMRQLLADESDAAKQAIELYIYRIKHDLGALVSVLGGLDMLIFTGGIGENAAQIRERVCADCDWIGLKIDLEKNAKNMADISGKNSKVVVRVMPTNEEWIIAKNTYQLISKET
jgi:acetate kinase